MIWLRNMFRMLYGMVDRVKRLIRYLYFKSILKKIGSACQFYGFLVVRHPEKLVVGNRVRFNNFIEINAKGDVFIGDDVHISSHVQIVSTELTTTRNYKERVHICAPIHVQSGAWLCAGAIIAKGVTVGEGSIVAANTVVFKDVPPYTLVAGSPAKVVRVLKK